MFPDGASPQRPAQETQHDGGRGRVTLPHLEEKRAAPSEFKTTTQKFHLVSILAAQTLF